MTPTPPPASVAVVQPTPLPGVLLPWRQRTSQQLPAPPSGAAVFAPEAEMTDPEPAPPPLPLLPPPQPADQKKEGVIAAMTTSVAAVVAAAVAAAGQFGGDITTNGTWGFSAAV
ncbi:hypothetical protein PLESTB_001338600 [Pleodorina starrii]|uniref:Uncharacterized protein n=1 Tax=Pleodorina starrii TaxID=330485 RepID=A0A9W6F6G6_9CHLO|nr:hypothetical protein PLESTB_001338600 [Pleodorina starrii]